MLDRTSGVILSLAVLAAVLGGGLAQYRRHHPTPAMPVVAPGESTMIGQPLPSLTLADLDGRVHALDEYRSRRLLINFWASWCGPCLQEMPALDDAQRKFGDQGVIVLGIAMDQADHVRAFLADQPVNYPILLGSLDAPSTSLQLGDEAEILPFSVLIGADGRIIASHAGMLSPALLTRWLAPVQGTH
ncbi:TlpA family protein disulfide reductase [Rhodanobacter lindaniclasticus]|uniref:Redoxin n=1 Tax=Rhodanobacter lindaniclasticus TaxID=75310 RepID=A0A4S3KI74_9GAMM|nr:TlpA disulfide reductase family protein [Rhodanobacter lindaniclasticus]THD08413.1 redoxin [Rhodanobacter lindaniclasticus]